MTRARHGFETRAIHAGQEPDPATGAVVPPISLSTTFAPGRGRQAPGLRVRADGNPTRAALEACLASLEGAAHGLAFASGMAAEDAVLRLLAPGDHVVLPDDAYGGTFRLVAQVLGPAGLEWSVARPHRPRRAASVTGPTARDGVGRDADQPRAHDRRHRRRRGRRARCAARASSSTTRSRRRTSSSRSRSAPTSSCTRATKYLGGHSDVVGGFAATSDRRARRAARLPAERGRRGAEPVRLLSRAARRQDARGAHGAPLRERARGRGAARRAPRGVDACCTRVSPTHPGHDVAGASDARLRRHGDVPRRRRRGRRARGSSRATRLFTLAESLGARRVAHRAPGPHDARVGRRAPPLAVDPALVRLSVGIETVDDLVADLTHALSGR